eukprot:13261-Heterococcus_DN1.PRE.1
MSSSNSSARTVVVNVVPADDAQEPPAAPSARTAWDSDDDEERLQFDVQPSLNEPRSPVALQQQSVLPAPPFWGRLKSLWFGVQSDLDVERIEDLRMLTGCTCAMQTMKSALVYLFSLNCNALCVRQVSTRELHAVRCQFLKRVSDPERITKSEFVAIPSVANNPLQERLLVCFGLHAAGAKQITFRDFLETLSTFNNPTAPVDLKMRAAFQLQDFDDDGEISKQDLISAYAGRQLTNVLHEFNKCKADS